MFVKFDMSAATHSLDICPSWKVACSSAEEWEELVESLEGGRKQESKRLYNYLNNELLPYVLQEISAKVSPRIVRLSHVGHVICANSWSLLL